MYSYKHPIVYMYSYAYATYIYFYTYLKHELSISSQYHGTRREWNILQKVEISRFCHKLPADVFEKNQKRFADGQKEVQKARLHKICRNFEACVQEMFHTHNNTESCYKLYDNQYY